MTRRAALVIVAWVLTVAAISATLWAVIGRVGRTVGQEAPYAQSTLLTPPPSARPTTPGPSPSVSTPIPTPTPTTRPTAGPRPRPTVVPSTRPPSPVRPTPPPPQPRTQTATFRSEGGTVVMSCRGSVPRVQAVLPRDGWSFEPPEVENGVLEVKFSQREDDDEDVELHLGCRAGAPVRID